MRDRIRAVPLPLAGVMLGFAALGNLIQSYSEGLRLLCGAISGLLLLLLILKLVLFPGSVREDMKTPIIASVAGTVPMGIMLLSVYLKPFLGGAAKILWLLAIALHAVLIVYFTIKFIFKLDLSKVFASYYIVYVGIVVSSVTAPAFEMTGLGSAAFWFGFVSLLALLVLVTVRYIKIRIVPEPAQPLFCIYAAPASLCLAGYLQSVPNKALGMVLFLAVLATALYVIALVKMVACLKFPFYPSYAAFTFPFIISAIAMKQTLGYLTKTGAAVPAFLQWLVLTETVIAAAVTVYTLIRFLLAIAKGGRKPIAQPAR